VNRAVKQRAANAAATLLAIVPFGIGQIALRLWLRRVAALQPRRAVRALLEIDADLTNVLNEAVVRYDNGVHVKHRLMRYHDFFVERVQRGERVLDVGCGKGELAYDLAERADAVVTGIDTNAAYLAFARQRCSHARVNYLHADALTYQPAAPVDVVVLSNVLEHIDQRVAFLRRIVEHARPQRLLIRVPLFERDWRVALRKELGMFYFSDSTHYTEYTAESFAAEMHDAALAIVHSQTRWGEIWAEAVPIAGQQEA
jgi:SAM-dependent methyltransferase